jgi:IclR family acetate operon transcriptional repressor
MKPRPLANEPSIPVRDPREQGPRSLGRVLALFDTIAKSADGVSLAKLSVQLGAPKSSLLMLLRPLVGLSYLTHESARYRLGSAAFRLAASIQSTRSLPRLMRPHLEALGAGSGESVYLAVADPDAKVFEYIDGLESQNPVRYWVAVGARRPLYVGSAGKLLLANQPDAWRERYLRSEPLKALASGTITNRQALKTELDAIRRQGYAVSRSEAVEGAGGIAAPVFNAADGSVAAALVIAAPESRFASELPRFRRMILEASASVSKLS